MKPQPEASLTLEQARWSVRGMLDALALGREDETERFITAAAVWWYLTPSEVCAALAHRIEPDGRTVFARTATTKADTWLLGPNLHTASPFRTQRYVEPLPLPETRWADVLVSLRAVDAAGRHRLRIRDDEAWATVIDAVMNFVPEQLWPLAIRLLHKTLRPAVPLDAQLLATPFRTEAFTDWEGRVSFLKDLQAMHFLTVSICELAGYTAPRDVLLGQARPPKPHVINQTS